MNSEFPNSIWRNLILRIIGWGILLCIFTLIITSYRSEYIQKQRYNEALQVYSAKLQQYNQAIADYEQNLQNYYDKVAAAYGISRSGTLLVDVSISTEKTNTEKIGNEIHYKYEINNKSVYDGGKSYIYPFSKNTIFCEIWDEDPSSDDIGNATDELLFSPSQLNNGTLVTQNISVHESYGRDAGNTATYRVVFTIRLHSTIDTQSIAKAPVYPQVTEPIKPELRTEKLRWYVVYSEDWFTEICIIILALVFSFLTIRKTRSDIDGRKKKLLEESLKKAAYEKERQEFLEAMQSKSLSELANVPPNITFDDEGLPIDTNSRTKYGRFTVYCTNSGTCYHTKQGCSTAKNEMHLFTAIKRRYSPCSKCAREKAIIPKWYADYQELLTKKKRLNL